MLRWDGQFAGISRRREWKNCPQFFQELRLHQKQSTQKRSDFSEENGHGTKLFISLNYSSDCWGIPIDQTNITHLVTFQIIIKNREKNLLQAPQDMSRSKIYFPKKNIPRNDADCYWLKSGKKTKKKFAYLWF